MFIKFKLNNISGDICHVYHMYRNTVISLNVGAIKNENYLITNGKRQFHTVCTVNWISPKGRPIRVNTQTHTHNVVLLLLLLQCSSLSRNKTLVQLPIFLCFCPLWLWPHLQHTTFNCLSALIVLVIVKCCCNCYCCCYYYCGLVI